MSGRRRCRSGRRSARAARLADAWAPSDRPPPGRGRGGSRTAFPRAAARTRAQTSVWRCAPAVGAALGSSSAITSSAVNSFPTTAPRSRTARSPGPSRSRRAASSAWTVSGSARSARPPSSREREELLEEERVALRRLDDPRSLVRLQSRPAETFEQCIRLVGRTARRAGRARRSRAPSRNARPVFEKLLARKADDRDRPRSLVREVLDELEEGRLRPVDVVEDEDERPLARARFAELAEEPGELGRRRRRLGVERCEDCVALRALGRLLREPHGAAST